MLPDYYTKFHPVYSAVYRARFEQGLSIKKTAEIVGISEYQAKNMIRTIEYHLKHEK